MRKMRKSGNLALVALMVGLLVALLPGAVQAQGIPNGYPYPHPRPAVCNVGNHVTWGPCGITYPRAQVLTRRGVGPMHRGGGY